MKSLRSRLILAFALVAIVPLGVSLVMWTRGIEATVRGDAEQRLRSALLRANGEIFRQAREVDSKLKQLASDATLRRAFLVGPPESAELREYLESQQRLLGLDYLWIEDLDGQIVANGIETPRGWNRESRYLLGTLDRADTIGVRLAVVGAPGDVRSSAIDGNEPIEYLGRRQAHLRGGMVLTPGWAGGIETTGQLAFAIFLEDHAPLSTRLLHAPFVETHPGLPFRPADRVRVGSESFLARSEPLAIGAYSPGTLVAYYSTQDPDATLRSLRLGAAGLAALALAVAIALGLLFSLQLSRPVERLAAFSDRLSRGEWDEPLREPGVRELRTLVESLERMRGDLAGTRERLEAGARQAAYGQMARKVAHEIKNPLTPIAISIADLQRSYDQKRPEFPEILAQAVRTIGDEVERLKTLIRDFSELGRFPPPRFDWFDLGEVWTDFATLYGHEVTAGRLALPASGVRMRADRAQVRQSLVNLVQNALDAVAEKGRVSITCREEGDHVEIIVADDGPGLGEELRANLFVPGFTTKPGGSGLGLTIVERIVTDHHGTIAVDSSPAGTTFRLRLPRNSGA